MKKAKNNKINNKIIKKSILSFYTILILLVFSFIVFSPKELLTQSDLNKSAPWKNNDTLTVLTNVNYQSKYVGFSQIYHRGQSNQVTFDNITVDTSKTYVIETAFDLYALSQASYQEKGIYLTLNYLLGTDIDYNEMTKDNFYFYPIGINENYPFLGTFDGQGFEIKNLYFAYMDYNESDNSVENQAKPYKTLFYLSMFPVIGVTGIVKNLGVKNTWVFQPSEWQFIAASNLIGVNKGLVENVYYIDDRVDQGMSIASLSEGFFISGLMFRNEGIFQNSFVSAKTVSSSNSQYTDDYPVVVSNNGTISNVYYDSSLFINPKTVQNINGITTSAFQEATIKAAWSNNGWFFNDSYSGVTLNNTYPILKGLEQDDDKLLIKTGTDLITMSELMKLGNFFRTAHYVIVNDIDFNQTAKNAYKTPKYIFAGTFEAAVITNPSTTTLYENRIGGASDRYSIIGFNTDSATVIGTYATYGLFGELQGTIKNINFVDVVFEVNDLASHNTRDKVSIGVLAGVINGGTIDNVHVYASITISENNALGIFYLGGLVGDGSGVIKNSTTNGSINGNTQTSYNNANNPGTISSIGGFIGRASGITIENSLNASTITGVNFNNTFVYSFYLGGIIGQGVITNLTMVENKGNIITHNPDKGNTPSVYVGGIIGFQTGQTGIVQGTNNKGSITSVVAREVVIRAAGYGYITVNTGTPYELNSLNNSGVISVTLKSGYNPGNRAEYVDVEITGVLLTYGANTKLTGLYNSANFSYDISLHNRIASVLIASNTQYTGSSDYDLIGNEYKTSTDVTYARNTGNITVTSSRTIWHNWIKVSGLTLGKNMNLSNGRNEGNININITHGSGRAYIQINKNEIKGERSSLDRIGNTTNLPQRYIRISGLIEEISPGKQGKNLYNGGNITFKSDNTNVFYANLYFGGITYKNAGGLDVSTYVRSYNGVDVDARSVDFKEVEGSLHNVVNDGAIYIKSYHYGQTRGGGIMAINQSLTTSSFNVADVYAENQIRVKVSSDNSFSWEFEIEVAGITFLMDGKHSQIRDSSNYGDIVAYNSVNRGAWLNASGIAIRNDKDELGVGGGGIGSNEQTQKAQLAKIVFTINYGNIYSWNLNGNAGSNTDAEVRAKSGGILALGILSTINNINYGNIYSQFNAGGIFGNVFYGTYVSQIAANEIYIANSINYGSIRKLTSTSAFSYDENNMQIIHNAASVNNDYQAPANTGEGFGGLIGIIRAGSTWNLSSSPLNKINLSYLVNFDSNTNVIGNSAASATNVSEEERLKATQYMAAIRTNDQSRSPFNGIKSFTLDESETGIFHTSFPLRSAPDTYNIETDKYIADFIQFIPTSKVNPNLLTKIGFSISDPDTRGIYALSSSAGIGEGVFMPDNVDLNLLNPIKVVNGEAVSDDSWQFVVNSDGAHVQNKFYQGMKQVKAPIATTIFDLDLYAYDTTTNTYDKSIKLSDPLIDLVNKRITYYVPHNFDAGNGNLFEEETITTISEVIKYTYVQVNPNTGTAAINYPDAGITTSTSLLDYGVQWITSTATNGNTGRYVGTHQVNGNNYYEVGPYLNTGIYNPEFLYTGRSGVSNNTQRYDQNNISHSATGTSYTLYVRSGTAYNNTNYWRADHTKTTAVAAGYGAYRSTGSGTSTYYIYVGPNTNTTYVLVPYTVTEEVTTTIYNCISSCDSIYKFLPDFNDMTSYRLASGASFKYEGNTYANNKTAQVLKSYGPYDINEELKTLGGTIIDTYALNMGSIRVYSASYEGDVNDKITYADYELLIVRVKPAEFTNLEDASVDNYDAYPNDPSNLKELTSSKDVLYKAIDENTPSIYLAYATYNLQDKMNLLDDFEIYKVGETTPVSKTLYDVYNGIVETTNTFFNIGSGEWGEGFVDFEVYLKDIMPHGNYYIEIKLSESLIYKFYFTKSLSSEKEIKSLIWNNEEYTYTTNTLTTYIPYGMYYNASDSNTNIVNFNGISSQITNPLYLDQVDRNLVLSEFASITNIALSISTFGSNQHRYTISYTVKAENESTNIIYHIIEEYNPNVSIERLFRDGGYIANTTENRSFAREEVPTYRASYDLTTTYFMLEPVITVYYNGMIINDGSFQVLYDNDFGYDIELFSEADAGNYEIVMRYNTSQIINGTTVTWNKYYDNLELYKLKNKNSKLTNIGFLSDTIYAGLNIIGDVRYANGSYMDASEYQGYLTNPTSRKLSILPHLGISYGNYNDRNEFWIVGQVQRTDLSVYEPSFTLPAMAEIRRITDPDNANDKDMQSTSLAADFTAGSTDNIYYVHYRVYAEAHTLIDPHYTDYYVAVQDITNTVYFHLEILLGTGVTYTDLARVFVTFDYYEWTGVNNNVYSKTNSMSLFSNFKSGTNEGDHLRFESTRGGDYKILLDFGSKTQGYKYEIESYGKTKDFVNINGSNIEVISHIIPRTYYLRITITKDMNINWGHQETTEFTGN